MDYPRPVVSTVSVGHSLTTWSVKYKLAGAQCRYAIPVVNYLSTVGQLTVTQEDQYHATMKLLLMRATFK